MWDIKKIQKRGILGIEPRASRTQSENHTTRPHAHVTRTIGELTEDNTPINVHQVYFNVHCAAHKIAVLSFSSSFASIKAFQRLLHTPRLVSSPTPSKDREAPQRAGAASRILHLKSRRGKAVPALMGDQRLSLLRNKAERIVLKQTTGFLPPT